MTTNGTGNGHSFSLSKRDTRKIWDAYGRPDDATTLAQHLWGLGYPIPVKTLQRWIKRWQELAVKGQAKPAADPAPRTMEDAAEKLDAEIPTILNDPMARTRELLVRLDGRAELAEVEGMEPAQLTRALSERMQRMGMLVADQIVKQREYLVRERPQDLGRLLKYLGEAMEHARMGYEKAIFLNEKLSGTDSKVIDHDPQEPHPMARALTHWGSA